MNLSHPSYFSVEDGAIKHRLRKNPSPSKRYQHINPCTVKLDRLEVPFNAGKKKFNVTRHLSKESKPKQFNLKFKTRPAETAIETYQRSKYSKRLQWVQKPKMVRLRDKGRFEVSIYCHS